MNFHNILLTYFNTFLNNSFVVKVSRHLKHNQVLCMIVIIWGKASRQHSCCVKRMSESKNSFVGNNAQE